MNDGNEEGAISLNKAGTILYFVGSIVFGLCSVILFIIIIAVNA